MYGGTLISLESPLLTDPHQPRSLKIHLRAVAPVFFAIVFFNVGCCACSKYQSYAVNANFTGATSEKSAQPL